MRQHYMSLSKFYEECLSEAREEGFIWVVSLVGRKADVEKTMKKMERHWGSLNDITAKKILFVFSAENIDEPTFFIRNEGYGNVDISPYGVVAGKTNVGAGKAVYSPERGQNEPMKDWQEAHTQSITEFCKKFKIKEKEIPCLFFVHLESNTRKLITIEEDINVYGIIKQFISLVEDDLIDCSNYQEQLEECEEYKMIAKYISLKEKLYKAAAEESNSPKEKEAIINIIENRVNYKEVSKNIRQGGVKSDLRKIKQWDRQFFNNLSKTDKYIKYNEIISEISRLKKVLKQATDNLDSIYSEEKRKEEEKMNKYKGTVINNKGIINVAQDNATIKVTQNNNINDIHEVEQLIREIKRELKRELHKVSSPDSETITSAMDIIMDEMKKEQPKPHVFHNCIAVLAQIMSVLNGTPVLANNIGKVIKLIAQLLEKGTN